jgi:hypothetical protein
MNKELLSKELQQIDDALNAYYEKHNGDVVISVSVSAFDKQSNVIDDYLWLSGDKEVLLVNNECMIEEIKNLVG